MNTELGVCDFCGKVPSVVFDDLVDAGTRQMCADCFHANKHKPQKKVPVRRGATSGDFSLRRRDTKGCIIVAWLADGFQSIADHVAYHNGRILRAGTQPDYAASEVEIVISKDYDLGENPLPDWCVLVSDADSGHQKFMTDERVRTTDCSGVERNGFVQKYYPDRANPYYIFLDNGYAVWRKAHEMESSKTAKDSSSPKECAESWSPKVGDWVITPANDITKIIKKASCHCCDWVVGTWRGQSDQNIKASKLKPFTPSCKGCANSCLNNGGTWCEFGKGGDMCGPMLGWGKFKPKAKK